MKIKLLLATAIAATGILHASSQVVVTGVSSRPMNSADNSNTDKYDVVDKSMYHCFYEYDIVATLKNGEKADEKITTILQIGPVAAKFMDYGPLKADSIAMFTENPVRQSRNINFTGVVFQNYPEGKITYTDIITPTFVEYEEDMPAFEWTLTEDTLTVCGYPCVKATCSYGGRDWEAWYTEEIPVSFGPWKFSGLPGLIMKARDTEGVHTFTATSFKKSDMPILRQENIQVEKTTRDKFVKNKNLFEKNPGSFISPESVSDVRVEKTADGGSEIYINGVIMPRRKNGYTPIELK